MGFPTCPPLSPPPLPSSPLHPRRAALAALLLLACATRRTSTHDHKMSQTTHPPLSQTDWPDIANARTPPHRRTRTNHVRTTPISARDPHDLAVRRLQGSIADLQVAETAHMDQDAGVPLAELRLQQTTQDMTRQQQTRNQAGQQPQDTITQSPAHQPTHQTHQTHQDHQIHYQNLQRRDTQSSIPPGQPTPQQQLSTASSSATQSTIPPGQPSPRTKALPHKLTSQCTHQTTHSKT